MNNFYTYLLRRPDKEDPFDPNSKQPFWVGKGSSIRIGQHRYEARASYKRPGRKSIKIKIIHKLWDSGLDFEEDIILSDCTEEEAYLYEKQAIAAYGRIDLGTGCLANRTSGCEIPEPAELNGRTITEFLQSPPRAKSPKQTEPHPLRAFFRAREISQEALGKHLELHQSQLSLWLSGRGMPDWVEEKLQAVADKILGEEEK